MQATLSHYRVLEQIGEGPPTRLFALSGSDWDISPDGQRFLTLEPAETKQAAPTSIAIVTNWLQELNAKIPSGR